MTGRRRLIALVAVPVLVLGAAGGVWLGETLGQSGQDQEDETEVHVAGECDYDPATGLPIPAPWCIPVAPCPTCTPPPFYAPPTPEPYTGPFKSNPNAVLTTQPVHRVGDAKELGRDDCPEGWQALVSDTTGLSFCFPPEAKVRSPAFDPHVGGWPGNWDELVFASLDAGVTVGVHRIGWTGGEPYEELIRYGESDFDGHPATTYEIRRDDNSAVSAGSLLQEEVGYLVQRPDGVWRILVEVRLDLPGNVPLRESEVGARRLLGEQIALTVILP